MDYIRVHICIWTLASMSQNLADFYLIRYTNYFLYSLGQVGSPKESHILFTPPWWVTIRNVFQLVLPWVDFTFAVSLGITFCSRFAKIRMSTKFVRRKFAPLTSGSAC